MSSKITVNKDLEKRKNFILNEKKHKIFNIILNDSYLPIESRHFISYSYIYDKYEALTGSFIKNRCVISGRSGAVYSFFKMTRMILKNLIVRGSIPGVRKSSW